MIAYKSIVFTMYMRTRGSCLYRDERKTKGVTHEYATNDLNKHRRCRSCDVFPN